jgi:hypothetical protein
MNFRAFDRVANAAALTVFGTSIIHTNQAGTATPITGTFNAAAESVDVGNDGLQVIVVRPMIHARIADFVTHPAAGDRFDVPGEGTFYAAGAPENDGYLMYKIWLRA